MKRETQCLLYLPTDSNNYVIYYSDGFFFGHHAGAVLIGTTSEYLAPYPRKPGILLILFSLK